MIQVSFQKLIVMSVMEYVGYSFNIFLMFCFNFPGMIPYPEPDQTMFQQRRLGALGVEWRPSSIKFSVGPDFSLGQDYIMPPLADLDRLIEPLPEFIDAMYWEPEHEVLSDDNDSEYNAEVSSDGARASPCSNSSNELECSSEDSDAENIHENSYHRKRKRKNPRVGFFQLMRFCLMLAID